MVPRFATEWDLPYVFIYVLLWQKIQKSSRGDNICSSISTCDYTYELTLMEVSWFLQIFLRFPLKRTFSEVAPTMFCPFNYTKSIST